MQENTNKAIAVNSLILYARMAITSICTLFATRFGLQALGVVDYGLFALLGGIIAFITILNNIMVSTSNRFIAVAIGKGDMSEANKQFNVNLVLHVGVALFVLVIAYPIGDWYIHNHVNYDGPISNAMMVYCITIAGCIISFISVPYHGLLMARERFIVFSGLDIILHIVKLIITWLLLYYFSDKLLIYTLAFAILHAVPTFYYMYYCSLHFPEIVRYKWVWDSSLYKRVFNFSAWIGVGAIAHSGKVYGAAIIVNAFFNTVMNTAMGVAATLNSYLVLFSQNIIQPMAPQITKSYAAGNQERTDDLLVMSTKYSFLMTLIIGAVFLSAPEWIMGLWLKEVPPYATTFLVLFVIDSILMSLNSGVQNIIFASGKIRLYQICTSTLNILSVALGYIVLRTGAPAYYLVGAYVVISAVRFFVIQWVLHYTLNYNNHILWKRSYLPSILVALLYAPSVFIPDMSHPFIKLAITFGYLCIIVYYVGLSRSERDKISGIVKVRLLHR